MYQPINAIKVYYRGFSEKRLVGHLTMDGARPVFGYDASWVTSGLELSPIEMPLQLKPFYGQHASSHHLCGLLSDSLPDGWGMLLMNRFFRQYHDQSNYGTALQRVSVLDRLAYIGDTALGALSFEPEHDIGTDTVDLNLTQLAHANHMILSGQDSEILKQLIVIGGSPQGARPKALVLFDKVSEFISTDLTLTHASASPWLIKFPAQSEHKSVCLLEALYADMAKRAGLNMPAHHYFDIDEANSAFGVQRFDYQDGQRVHIHTLAGLLDLDFRIPSLDYLQYLRCVRMLTQSQPQVEAAFRQAVFNVVFNNKDDHSKNFSFLMDKDGLWSISPSYDLSYNTGMNGYHQMDICGEALQPTLAHLLKLAKLADIKANRANQICEQVVSCAQQFLSEVTQYPIDPPLLVQVIRDVENNIKRMT